MRTLLISDLHIGFRYSRASDIVRVLDEVKYDRLILNGDIFDISNMMASPYWDEHHTAALKKILKVARKKETHFIIGNHDYPFVYLLEDTQQLVNLHLHREFVYESGGRRILCIHGDQLDDTNRRLQGVGDTLYRFGLWLNKYVNMVRSWCGLPYWSISKWGKDQVKNFIARAFDMQGHMMAYRDKHQADVLVYGHTHMPYVKPDAVNTGTFVEIATYVIEEDGVFTLYDLDNLE